MQAPPFESLITPPWPPSKTDDEASSPYTVYQNYWQSKFPAAKDEDDIDRVAVLGYN